MANDVTVDSSGNSYVVGTISTDPFPHEALWIRKYDVCGNEVWTYNYLNYGFWQHTEGTAIEMGPDGFLYVAGVAFAERKKIFVGKLDPNAAPIDPATGAGRFAWEVFANGPAGPTLYGRFDTDDAPFDLAVDSSGNVFVVGRVTRETVPGLIPDKKNDVWVGKIVPSADGTSASLVVQQTYNGADDRWDEASEVKIDPDGSSIYVIGTLGTGSSSPQAWINKYSTSDLTPLWPSPVVGAPVTFSSGGLVSTQEGKALVIRDGTLYTGGGTHRRTTLYYDGWVDLYTPEGLTIGDPIILSFPAPSDWVNDLLVTTDSIFLTGIQSDGIVLVEGAVNSGDIWVAKMDRITHTIGWHDVIAGDLEESDRGRRLALDSLGNLHVVGSIQKSFSGPSREGVFSTSCTNHCHTDMWIRMYCPAEMGGTPTP